jgi:hypothetical protein
MTHDGAWYEVVSGSQLMQGDLLRNCPIAKVNGFEQWPASVGRPLEVEVYLTKL